MKIICLQEKLKEALTATEKVVGKNTNLPVLSNLLIQAEKNQIQISSTDLELALVYQIPGKIEEEGKIVLPAKLISTFINNITGSKKITLESKKYNVSIKAEDYKAQILGINPEEFPIIPRVKEQYSLSISSSVFVSGLERVVKSVGMSEVRPEITGVLFKTDTSRNMLILASTDSFRLSEQKIPLKNITQDFSFILPLKSVNEVIRVFNESNTSEEELSLVHGEQNQTLVKGEQIELISRVIEGEFPRYQEIIPEKTTFTINVPRSLLIPKIRAMSVFSSRSHDVVLTFLENKIEISARESGAGEGKATLKLNTKSSVKKNLSVIFNWKFLLDGLENIDTDEVVFKLNSEVQPVLLTSAGDKNFLYILMPIKNT